MPSLSDYDCIKLSFPIPEKISVFDIETYLSVGLPGVLLSMRRRDNDTKWFKALYVDDYGIGLDEFKRHLRLDSTRLPAVALLIAAPDAKKILDEMTNNDRFELVEMYIEESCDKNIDVTELLPPRLKQLV
ncbi:MAG: hypothetical protein KDH96_09700 [Candidatus Riesia sp.]|nr:hypothetical protein [Candidatus Riesia sp.]